MIDPEKIKALKWIELSIASENKKVGIFEWPDISRPKRKIGDNDNDKNKGETKEKETQDDEANSSSNEGMIALTNVFQSYSDLEAYATKYMANNK